VNPQAPHNLVH
jgi:dynein intermediate chain 1